MREVLDSCNFFGVRHQEGAPIIRITRSPRDTGVLRGIIRENGVLRVFYAWEAVNADAQTAVAATEWTPEFLGGIEPSISELRLLKEAHADLLKQGREIKLNPLASYFKDTK